MVFARIAKTRPTTEAMKMNKRKVESLAAQAWKILDELERVKPMYARLEELTEALTNAKKADLKEHGLQIVDNFETKNVVWKSSAVRRFELKKVEDE